MRQQSLEKVKTSDELSYMFTNAGNRQIFSKPVGKRVGEVNKFRQKASAIERAEEPLFDGSVMAASGTQQPPRPKNPLCRVSDVVLPRLPRYRTSKKIAAYMFAYPRFGPHRAADRDEEPLRCFRINFDLEATPFELEQHG
jgi:hypothetical protein